MRLRQFGRFSTEISTLDRTCICVSVTKDTLKSSVLYPSTDITRVASVYDMQYFRDKRIEIYIYTYVCTFP